MNGKNQAQEKKELDTIGLGIKEQKKLIPFKVFEGNKPTNTILIDKLIKGLDCFSPKEFFIVLYPRTGFLIIL